jgi:hypothetical protein
MNCPSCGFINAPDASFCNKCGTDLRPKANIDTPTNSSSDPLLKSNMKRPIRGWIWLMGSVGAVLIVSAGIVIYKRQTANPDKAWEQWETNTINIITPDYNNLIVYQPWAPPAYQEQINADASILETDVNNCITEGQNLTASTEMKNELQWFRDGLGNLSEGASYLTASAPENMASLDDADAATCFYTANEDFDKAGLTLSSQGN